MQVCPKGNAVRRHIGPVHGHGNEMGRLKRPPCRLFCEDAALIVAAKNGVPETSLSPQSAIGRVHTIKRNPGNFFYLVFTVDLPVADPVAGTLFENDGIRSPIERTGPFLDNLLIVRRIVADDQVHFVRARPDAGVHGVFDTGAAVVPRPHCWNRGELRDFVELVDVDPVKVLDFDDYVWVVWIGPQDPNFPSSWYGLFLV